MMSRIDFAIQNEDTGGGPAFPINIKSARTFIGITKEEYFFAAIMQGMCVNFYERFEKFCDSEAGGEMAVFMKIMLDDAEVLAVSMVDQTRNDDLSSLED